MRRTSEQLFIVQLSTFATSTTTGVTTKDLRAKFTWNEKKFNTTRESLIRQGKIKAAPGQGGKTVLIPDALATVLPPKKPKIFISYSHKDETHKLALENHLMPLKRLGLVESWSDKEIFAGQNVDRQIDTNLSSADIVLLLISIDFINSHYCYEREMNAAFEREKKGQLRIIPIILRPCFWHKLPFGSLKALPKDGNAVATYPVDEVAFVEVAEELHKQTKLFIEHGGWEPKRQP